MELTKSNTLFMIVAIIIVVDGAVETALGMWQTIVIIVCRRNVKGRRRTDCTECALSAAAIVAKFNRMIIK